MADDVYELAIVGNVGGQFCENIIHYESSMLSDPNPGPAAAELISLFQSNIEAAWLACLPSDFRLEGYRSKRVNNTGGPTEIMARPGVVGTYADTSFDSGQGPLICGPYFQADGTKHRWRTTRIFLPSFPRSGVVENVIQPTLVTAVTTLCGLLDTAISGSRNFIYGAWSRKYNTFYQPTLSYCSSHIATQRRRLKPVL